jgi:hypothetical protein
MKKKWIAVIAPPAMVLFVWIFGEIVMHLWNWLLPMLFGWRQITFWQALGLLVLCRILFGGFGSHKNEHRSKLREKFYERRWEQMTPEEREQLGQELRRRWCAPNAPTAETKEPA